MSPDLIFNLQQDRLLSTLKPDTLAGFAAHTQRVRLKKGDTLFLPDSPNDRVYIIETGWVKLFKETVSGEEAIIDILKTKELLGEIGLPGAETVPYGAQAIEDTTLLSLPRFLLAEEIMRNGVFGLKALDHLTRQKHRREMEIEHRTVQTAPQRLGCFLLKLCSPRNAGSVRLNLPYDKAVVANSLGMKPETFSRAIAKLREENLITVASATVEIPSVEALAAYTCMNCSSHFPCDEA